MATTEVESKTLQDIVIFEDFLFNNEEDVKQHHSLKNFKLCCEFVARILPLSIKSVHVDRASRMVMYCKARAGILSELIKETYHEEEDYYPGTSVKLSSTIYPYEDSISSIFQLVYDVVEERVVVFNSARTWTDEDRSQYLVEVESLTKLNFCIELVNRLISHYHSWRKKTSSLLNSYEFGPDSHLETIFNYLIDARITLEYEKERVIILEQNSEYYERQTNPSYG